MTTFDKDPRVAFVCPHCGKLTIVRLNDVPFETEEKKEVKP